MIRLSTFALAALTLTSMLACGSAPPPPPVVVYNDPPPPPPPVQPTCSEQWVHMPVLIGFPSGGTDLDAQNRMILAEVVRTASTRDDILRVRVEGHTDTCGSEADNMRLSEQRAISVASELAALGVDRSMLETVGRGSIEPRAEEACEGPRQAISQATNRRVEFSILTCRADL